MERVKAKAIHQRMRRFIPGGVNSPVRAFGSIGITPVIVREGKGSKITDVDGRSYIDYCGSWGPLILGHANDEVLNCVRAAVDKGTTFGISTEIEGEIAEEVQRLIPSMELMRFVSSGTEATMSAARVARGYTGRDLIVKFDGHYHGHSDSFLAKAGSGLVNLNSNSSSLGVPQDFVKQTLSIPYNDFEALEKTFVTHAGKIAAVILEPVSANMGVVAPKKGFLERLRALTSQDGALLIFDEVVTGFRLSLGGAQEYFNIKPDMTCLGKIVGGGFPAAAFGGRRAIMESLAPLGGVYQAGTLSGNPIAMHAGLTTLKLLQKPNFYQELQRKTNLLTAPIISYIQKSNLPICFNQVGSMFTLFFGRTEVTSFEEAKLIDTERYKTFFQDLLEQGIYAPPSAHEAWFVSMAHTDEELSRSADIIIKCLIGNE